MVLPLLMVEFSKEWAEITKHIFASCTTKQAKIMQVLRLSLKSSGADSWHHRNGYQHALKQ
jgi:hypothetical protein